MKINKTNAARLLDKSKIAYELIPYEVDEKDLSAIHVAASLGEDIDCVFKTLILHGDKTGYFVCVIPGEHEVDLKLAAKVSGNKKCDLIPVKELLPLTGICLRQLPFGYRISYICLSLFIYTIKHPNNKLKEGESIKKTFLKHD